MGEYTKPWNSVEQQIDRLAGRGVDVEPRDRTAAVLCAVGYYRLTGYLYPFRLSESRVDERGRVVTEVLDGYRPEASIRGVEQIIDFDRRLRLLVLDGVERLEIAVRMRVGYVLGRRSPFAHLDGATFVAPFVERPVCPTTGECLPSRHDTWLARVAERRDGSDEAFVAHFRDQYDGQMPIWTLTEILELGHLSRLYQALTDEDAREIAAAFGVPAKRVMASWLASVNYVRNVAAHHARLFNRRLQHAPARPRPGVVPLLDHLRDESRPKGAFGVYNALAVIAFLLGSVDAHADWSRRLVSLLEELPSTGALSLASLGVPGGWRELDLWHRGTGAAATSGPGISRAS